MVARLCSIDMNSVMSWRLNAQVSTTCSPCVLMTRTTWPAVTKAALPRRAGMVMSGMLGPLLLAPVCRDGGGGDRGLSGAAVTCRPDHFAQFAIPGTGRMQPVATDLRSAVDQAVAEARGNLSDGSA